MTEEIEPARGPGHSSRVLYRGRVQSLRAWSRELGIKESAIRYRLKAGWTVAKALSQKPAPRFKRLR